MGPLLNTQEKEKKKGGKGRRQWTASKKRSLPGFFFSLFQAVYRAQEDSNASFPPAISTKFSRPLLLSLSLSLNWLPQTNSKFPPECIFERPDCGSLRHEGNTASTIVSVFSFLFFFGIPLCFVWTALCCSHSSASLVNPRCVLAAGQQRIYLHAKDSIANCPCGTT